jgi:hypothetical protein
MRRLISLYLDVIFLATVAPSSIKAQSAAPTPAKPYLVEWVYRVQYGHQDEWWSLFRKYQIAALDREQQLGYVTTYTVYGPGLHTSEEAAGTTASSSPTRTNPPPLTKARSCTSSSPTRTPSTKKRIAAGNSPRTTTICLST